MSEQKTTALVLRSANRINEDTFARIWKFYFDTKATVELKEKEEEIRQRLVKMWDLLSGDVLTDRKAVLAHVKWCNENGINIKERTAYEDLNHAKMLFGDPARQSKSAQRAIANEILLNLISKCIAKNKFMSAARLIKEYNELNDLKNHIDGKEAPKAPIFINFSSDPETLKKQIEEMRRKAEAAQATDTSYEDA